MTANEYEVFNNYLHLYSEQVYYRDDVGTFEDYIRELMTDFFETVASDTKPENIRIGSRIIVPPSENNHGGVAIVKKISNKPNAVIPENRWFVSFDGIPGMQWNLLFLLNEQDRLKKSYGKSIAKAA